MSAFLTKEHIMRWYKIVAGSTTFDATGDANALNVELDIPVAVDHNPKSGAFVRVWGIARQTLLNARSFNNQPIQVFGGMQKGQTIPGWTEERS